MGGIQIKKYNGSAWVDGAIKKYNGSSWVDGYTYKWNGSAWVQIYPDTFVSTSKTITGDSTTWTYRAKVYKNWKKEDAKQGSGGNYSSSGGSGDSNHYGFLNLSSNKFTGHGDVNSVSSASYTAKRGGAGKYNNNQTIKFYRGNIVPTSPSSASPVDTLSGNFTCTTGSNVGSGGTMSNRSIDGLDNFKNWMNGVSGKSQLYISSSSKSDYLSIKGASTVKASYVYRADVITYVPSGGGAAASYSLRSPFNTYSTRTTTTSFGSGSVLKKVQSTVDDAYHTMVIYPEEKNMTLDEIVAYRTENNLPDISINDILTDYVKQPVIKDFKIDHDNHMVKVQLDGLQDGHIPEFSIDGDNYYLMSSPSVDIYTGDLTSEFDKNRDYVYIRVRNEITDSIDLEYIEEPLFLVV